MRNLIAFIALAGMQTGLVAAEYAQAGALAKDGRWELSVIYDNTVKLATALSPENYLLPSEAQLEDLRSQTLNNSVILVISGLATNSVYNVTLTNIQTSGGTVLQDLKLAFTTKNMSWATVGSQELGFSAEAISAGEGGFDLVSGAGEMGGTYDESTFAYEEITGDFDKRVRVASQEASSIEARAGLMVREVLDEKKARPIDPANPEEAFSRYLQIHVNPVGTAFTEFDGTPVPGRNLYQINFRPLPGGVTEQPLADTNAPAYPNAWMRLKRVGQTFFVFRGTDGTNWVRLGTFTFPTTDLDGNPVPAFARTVYVGPNYSPELANIPLSTGVRREFVASFRDYSNASGDVVVEEPAIAITRNGPQVEISWTAGTLQGATNLLGNSWVDLGTASPLKLTPDKRYQFFRARNP